MTRIGLISVVVLTACGAVDLPVVDIPDGGEKPCSDNAGCLGGQYCSRMSCSGTGVCRQRPISCNGEYAPECGCDGVTYFNACLRRAAGESFAAPDFCDNPRLCDTTSNPCAAGQRCARLGRMPQDCGTNIAGTCWVLPDVTCTYPAPAPPPAPPPAQTYTPCGPPTTACLDLCAAIEREAPVFARPRNAGPCP